MIETQVYVRARTSDDRWASVNVADLDERSFRLWTAQMFAMLGVVIGIDEHSELRTPLTKQEAEERL